MDITKLKNGKYFLGEFKKSNQYRGWFIGSFFEEGHPCKTTKLEILYREHKAGHKCKAHYHKKKVELIIMLEGKAICKINGNDVTLDTGKFLFVDTNNIIEANFLENSKIFAIHAPSIPTDKIAV